MKIEMCIVSVKMLVLILMEMIVSQSQTTCSAYRQLPFPYVETGYIAPMANGTNSGLRSYMYTYKNTYGTILGMPGLPIIGIRTFKSSSPNNVIDFKIYNSNNTYTSTIFNVQTGSGYSIQYMEINYLIYSVFAGDVNHGTFVFYHTDNSTRGQDPNYQGNLTCKINISNLRVKPWKNTTLPAQSNKLHTYINMFNVTSTLGNLHKFALLSTDYLDTVFMKMIIYKPLGVSIRQIFFNTLYYTIGSDYQGLNDMKWGGTLNVSSSGGTYLTGNMWATSFVINGLAFMQFYNQSTVMDYESSNYMDYISTATINPQKPYNALNIGLKSTLTTFFHVFRFYCTDNSYIYNTVDGRCYSYCPAGTVRWGTYGKCYGCAYTCVTCTSTMWDAFYGTKSTCTTCNASNFRTLVNGKCACTNAQYFDDGYSSKCRTCASVNNLTATCSFTLDSNQAPIYYSQLFAGNWTTNVIPLYTSLNCSAGYIVFNNLCTTCSVAIPYCISCTNASWCTTCNASTTRYTDGKCYLCNVTNCIMCKQNNVCDQCAAGYIVNGSSCIVEPCNSSCTCGGFYLPKVNGSCTTLCGDGLKVETEECDDGNTVDRDGCSSSCKIQTCAQNCSCSGWYFPVVNGSCSILCGDGFKVAAEECDDGNTLSNDGCSSTCKIQTCAQNCSCDGYVFPVVNNTCSTLCGDGIQAGLQECDDGNTISGDACSSTCVKQNCSAICTCDGWALPKINGTCSTVCGDGLYRGNQQCDDGNLINYDGCSSTCQTQGCNVTCNCSGWTFPRVNGLCTSTCGDSIVVGTEECDDGNTVDGDGCSFTCKSQPCEVSCKCGGWYLPRVGSSCSSICGDGIKTTSEQCDDSNTQDHDGCNSTCKIQTLCNQSCSCDGWTRPFVNGSCSAVCGDGLLKGKEECDDGNTLSHDGCTYACTIQTLCSQSCSCDGWTQPYINGSCSTTCGDGLLRGKEQCDDGNTNSHDGCNSICKIETLCNESCSCGGWSLPFVNGSCSTICGDGIALGLEECDDNNTVQGDGCSNCTIEMVLMKTGGARQFLFFSEQKTHYGSLGLFCMGFRLVGMEMLWVFQSFQLLLSTQESRMKISNNIHGYSDPKDFPFKIPNLQTQLFDKFNYMFFLILFVFIVCTFLETLGECCRSGNQIANSMDEESPLTFSKGPNGFKQKEYKFEEDRDDGNEEFTVHYDKRSNYKNDLLSETQALSVDISELQAPPQPPTYLSKLSRTILRQFFFDMIMNVQPVIFTTLVTQGLANGIESIMNFPTLITFGTVELFFIGSLLFCWRGGEFFGQNQAKFQENKFMRYWVVTSAEKVLISVVIGGKMGNYLYIIGGVKLLVMIYFWVDKVYYSKVQNYRCIVIHTLHFLLFAGFIVNKVYLTPYGVIQKLPINMMEIGYTSILGLVFAITAVFYFRQITSKCQANTRHVSDEMDHVIHERLFYSRKDIDESGAKIKSKISPTSQSIVEEIKGRQIGKNNSVVSQKSRMTSKPMKRPQQDYRVSEEYEDNNEAANRSKLGYNNSKRRQYEPNQRYDMERNFRSTEDQFEENNGARSTKGRSFMKTRRAGRKNNPNHENNPNKENNAYKSRFTQQSEVQNYNEYQGSRSAYQNQGQNNSNPSKLIRAQTQRNVKSRRDIRDSQENSNDIESNNGPVSLRFR